MYISAQLPAEEAVTEDEKSQVHTRGEHMGTFFTGITVQLHPKENGTGEYDFSEAYMEALKQFLEQEPRVAQGKSFGFNFSH